MTGIADKITYRAYASYPGGTTIGKSRKPTPVAAPPNLQLPQFSAQIVLSKDGFAFHPRKAKNLEKALADRGLLAWVQKSSLNPARISGPEIRFVYIGGPLDIGLKDPLNVMLILPLMWKKPAEIFLPLDLVYMGEEEAKPDPQRQALSAKMDYIFSRKSPLFFNLDVNPSVDYAIFHDDQMIEARGRAASPSPCPLVIRVYSSTPKMLNYLPKA